MFEEGNIIYFDPFYFKNGNTAKAKYFVVLKNDGKTNIIASLPTSKDFIPEENVTQQGCVELPEKDITCFVISNSQVITECGKKFGRTTYLYGQEIDDYEIQS